VASQPGSLAEGGPSGGYADAVSTSGAVFDGWDGVEGVSSAIAAARDGVDALLRDRGLRRTTPELTTESLLRGAAASAELAGSTTDLEALRTGSGDLIAVTAARVNSDLLGLVPVVGRSPLQVLARLHTLAAVGSLPTDQLGRPRPEAGVAEQLKQLSAALLAATSQPGAVVAAVTHAELVRIAPFASHNDIVARAVERLLLVAKGVDPASMLVPEAGHLALAADYRAGLAAYAGGTPVGRARWLLHAAQALTGAASASPLAR
jgi:hypothetical protein